MGDSCVLKSLCKLGWLINLQYIKTQDTAKIKECLNYRLNFEKFGLGPLFSL